MWLSVTKSGAKGCISGTGIYPFATTPKPVSGPTWVDIQWITVGITTRYGLHRPGIETQWGSEIFRTRSDRPWGSPTLQYDSGSFFSRGVKRPGRGDYHPLPPSTEVKERVELYLYSPSGPSWPVVGCTLPRVKQPGRDGRRSAHLALMLTILRLVPPVPTHTPLHDAQFKTDITLRSQFSVRLTLDNTRRYPSEPCG